MRLEAGAIDEGAIQVALKENKKPAVRWQDSLVASFMASAPLIAGVLGVLTLPFILQLFLGVQVGILVWQAYIAHEIIKETGRLEAATPEDSYKYIREYFGPILSPLVDFHENIHRNVSESESVTYVLTYFATLPVLVFSGVTQLITGLKKIKTRSSSLIRANRKKALSVAVFVAVVSLGVIIFSVINALFKPVPEGIAEKPEIQTSERVSVVSMKVLKF